MIPPLYESRSDVDIMCDLAREMDLDDELLKQGYEACMDWIIDGCGLTVADLKASDLPVKVPIAKWPAQAGKVLENGFKTSTGKFEFYATAIASIDPQYGLDPCPATVIPWQTKTTLRPKRSIPSIFAPEHVWPTPFTPAPMRRRGSAASGPIPPWRSTPPTRPAWG